MFVRKVGIHPQDYTVSQHRKQQSGQSLYSVRDLMTPVSAFRTVHLKAALADSHINVVHLETVLANSRMLSCRFTSCMFYL
jgi:hypothetical protein